jgi:AcrR family transcriptional regulator
MAPKAIEFSRDTVLAAAVKVVRQQGLDGLSARSVAARLKASVAPVYTAFASMAKLERGVLDEARRLLDERTRQNFSEMPFLNIGVGIVTFARDEPRLFSALFLARHPFQDILAAFHDSVLARMKTDDMLHLLPDAALERLLDSLWFYTLGLSSALVHGQLVEAGDEHLIRYLRNMGNILILAEVMGVADGDSPENEKVWKRVMSEKGIPWPEQKNCPAPVPAQPPVQAAPSRQKAKKLK